MSAGLIKSGMDLTLLSVLLLQSNKTDMFDSFMCRTKGSKEFACWDANIPPGHHKEEQVSSSLLSRRKGYRSNQEANAQKLQAEWPPFKPAKLLGKRESIAVVRNVVY